ncbi:MAG TPA: PAS and helix-turn-helix domain-containing protein [Candidatus Solibacter sp.]|nr:PAS and helix-turn-helix domain-containing protein [Candidatus Solibacter sp.]
MLERELFALLEGTADAAFSVDEQGLIRSWNRAAEKLFGYPGQKVLDHPCSTLFQGRGPMGNTVCCEDCSVLECAHAKREVSNYDLEVLARGGQRLWVNVSILIFFDDRTKRRMVVHLARDITSRKQKEDLAAEVVGAARRLSALSNVSAPAPPVSPLSQQERRVLALLAEGKSPADITRLLRITSRTLRNHISNAGRKLGTRSRLETVIHASRRNLI